MKFVNCVNKEKKLFSGLNHETLNTLSDRSSAAFGKQTFGAPTEK